jgi:hypothetical protein
MAVAESPLVQLTRRLEASMHRCGDQIPAIYVTSVGLEGR